MRGRSEIRSKIFGCRGITYIERKEIPRPEQENAVAHRKHSLGIFKSHRIDHGREQYRILRIRHIDDRERAALAGHVGNISLEFHVVGSVQRLIICHQPKQFEWLFSSDLRATENRN